MKPHLLLPFCLLSACKPPATDDYATRVDLDQRNAPSPPIVSPDTEGALWASGGEDRRLIYGKPGEVPLVALECVHDADPPMLRITRFARADAEAKALMALIGNAHIARLPVEAHWTGKAWLWRGEVDASTGKLEVLTGRRQVELTIPGAGSVILNPSAQPARLVADCRDIVIPAPERTAEPG